MKAFFSLACLSLGLRAASALSGRFICEDEPLWFAKVAVKRSETLDEVDSFHLDDQGTFQVDLQDDGSNYTLTLILEHESDEYGTLKVYAQNYVHEVSSEDIHNDIGEIFLDESTDCVVYTSMMAAVVDYKDRVGEPIEQVVRATFPAFIDFGGTPYALYDWIQVPQRYSRFSRGTAKHELAHAIRHKADGSIGHFLWDALRFWYPRTHYCSSQFNGGFAFNEGWAQFWEDDCHGFDADGSMQVEGNVAEASRHLQDECGTTDAEMWQVLFENRGRVHYYSSYETRHRQLYNCPQAESSLSLSSVAIDESDGGSLLAFSSAAIDEEEANEEDEEQEPDKEVTIEQVYGIPIDNLDELKDWKGERRGNPAGRPTDWLEFEGGH